MNVLATLGSQVAGAAAAIYVDRNFPEYEQQIGSFTVTPGLIAGVVLAVGAATVGSKLPASARGVIANAAGGMLVYEGAKLAEDKVLPLLSGNGGTAQMPASPTVQGYFGPSVGCNPSYANDGALTGALARIRGNLG